MTGGIDSLESIFWLVKRLKIQAQEAAVIHRIQAAKLDKKRKKKRNEWLNIENTVVVIVITIACEENHMLLPISILLWRPVFIVRIVYGASLTV